MSDLDQLRRRIDALDRSLVELLEERMQIALEVGRHKRAQGLPLYDPERERHVLDRIVGETGSAFPPRKLRAVFREIISASRTEQADQLVLVHGDLGGLAHHAAMLRFGSSVRFEATHRAETLFARLTDTSAGYALLSFEGRSLEPSFDRLDLFLHSDLRVTGESRLRPRLALYAPEPRGAGPVFGTAAAFAQASHWVARAPSLRSFHVAGSQVQAKEEAERNGGALLSHPVCEPLFGWSAIESDLEDSPQPWRRFHVVGGREPEPTGADRTLLLVVLANRAGALHQVTEVLARYRINLSWIEPKPTHLGTWDHLFLLELDGHERDDGVAAALVELKARAQVLRVLGSYPREGG